MQHFKLTHEKKMCWRPHGPSGWSSHGREEIGPQDRAGQSWGPRGQGTIQAAKLLVFPGTEDGTGKLHEQTQTGHRQSINAPPSSPRNLFSAAYLRWS